MDDIKQIKPSTDTKTSDDSGDSILISKINPDNSEEASMAKKNSVGSEKKKWIFSKINLTPKQKKALKYTGYFFLALFVYLVISSVLIFASARKLNTSVKSLISAGESQNLPEIKQELENTKNSLKSLRGRYKLVRWTSFVPFFGRYISDGYHGLEAGNYGLEALEILIEVAGPYADILGFENNVLGEDEGSGEKTAKDRIDFIVKTLPDLVPKIDILSEKTHSMRQEIDFIDPEIYPVKFGKTKIREKLSKGKRLVELLDDFITNGKPLLKEAPYILGMDEVRNYLILFQNDKELRPTGGFLTAYSIVKVDKAKFEPVVSNDIYDLDLKYNPNILAPDPIINYLKGPYVLEKGIRLRDMNWSPDFYESMKLFTDEAVGIGVDDIDGIIAVDTKVLEYLLDVIGPIGVSGFGNFSTEIIPECNCPQVIYELESFADIEGPIIWDPITGEIILRPPNSDNRKRIIGPLMNSILANALAQPKDKLAELFKAGYKSLSEKHVLFFLKKKTAQAAVESFNIAGTIKSFDGDYLHINDANLGGRKSNLYVTQEVVQDIEIAKDGSVVKTVTITYKNPEPYDGWLNSVLPNWVRIYVPEGSELIDISGLEDKEEPYNELGKTVFAGGFELRPQGVAKVSVTYKLPFTVEDDYTLLIQKQPGKDMPIYTINIGKKTEELFLGTDREFNFSL